MDNIDLMLDGDVDAPATDAEVHMSGDCDPQWCRYCHLEDRAQEEEE